MDNPLPTDFNGLPYSDYALVYVDSAGQFQAASSPSMQDEHGVLFTRELQERFVDALVRRDGNQRSNLRSM